MMFINTPTKTTTNTLTNNTSKSTGKKSKKSTGKNKIKSTGKKSGIKCKINRKNNNIVPKKLF